MTQASNRGRFGTAGPARGLRWRHGPAPSSLTRPDLKKRGRKDTRERRSARSAWLILPLAWALAGCSASPAGPVAIVPDSSTGRRALEAAMAAWKAGRTPGAIEPTSPRVQVVDTHRTPGQRLEGYEILAESADSRTRSFQVRLTLANPDERPIARYLTVGIDPVVVFRQEDYELLMHWEHRMDPDEASGPSPGLPPR